MTNQSILQQAINVFGMQVVREVIEVMQHTEDVNEQNELFESKAMFDHADCLQFLYS